MSTAAMTMIQKTITKVCGTLRFFMDVQFAGKVIEKLYYFCRKEIIMRKTCLILLVCFALVSCHKQEPSGGDTPTPSHPTYEIGQYFHNDTLEGIVFYTTSGGAHGLMVSLDETLLQWCIDTYINEETGATNPYDGWNNTNIVMANYDLYSFPTIDWSYRRNTWNYIHYPHRLIDHRQWYVPSSTEMRYLLMNQTAVNITLDSLGYPTLEDKTYWSSTELGTKSAAVIQVQDSSIIVREAVKNQVFYVRAVRNY